MKNQTSDNSRYYAGIAVKTALAAGAIALGVLVLRNSVRGINDLFKDKYSELNQIIYTQIK